MKYLKLALLSLAERKRTSLILLVQLTAVFLVVSVVIGSVNSRSILHEPYKDILTKQGWYIAAFGDPEGTAETYFKDCSVKPELLIIHQAFAHDSSGRYYKIAVLPEMLFEGLRLPSAHTSSEGDAGRVYGFAARGDFDAGDSLDLDLGDGKRISGLKVSHLLTDPTYYPIFRSYRADGDISMLYQSISSDTERDNYLIISERTAEALGIPEDYLSSGAVFIAWFPEPLDDSEYEPLAGFIESMGCAVPLKEILRRTDKQLNDDVKRYAPLAVISVIVVIIGTAGAIAIQTLREMKRSAVLYLCGMKWRRIMLISLFRILLLLTAAAIISGAAMILLQTGSIAAKLGMVFDRKNIYAAAGLAALTVCSSMVMPAVLLRRTSPAEAVRRIKND